jgi:hypothetical protein
MLVEDAFDATDAALLLGISEAHFLRLVRTGRIAPATCRRQNRRLWPASAIRAALVRLRPARGENRRCCLPAGCEAR